jgi:hypothetical protein
MPGVSRRPPQDQVKTVQHRHRRGRGPDVFAPLPNRMHLPERAPAEMHIWRYGIAASSARSPARYNVGTTHNPPAAPCQAEAIRSFRKSKKLSIRCGHGGGLTAPNPRPHAGRR